MSSYLIDRIPDDRLPSLTPRLLGEHTVLVTLADCAPFLSTFPLEYDELRHALVRLLTVPGGPLVARDDTPCGTLRTNLLWTYSDKPVDALTLSDIGLGAEVSGVEEHIDLTRVKNLVVCEVTYSLDRAERLPWWPHAKALLERGVCRNFTDAMLAGVPEGGEP